MDNACMLSFVLYVILSLFQGSWNKQWMENTLDQTLLFCTYYL